MGDAARQSERLRTLLLAGLVAIYVARPLLPSESPTIVTGDGLPFVMLTLILAATWSLAQLIRPDQPVRFGPVDWAWVGLLAWQAASASLATHSGYARGAINTFWEWSGLGIGFLLLRQLMRSGREKRAVSAVMFGLALTLSADGLYQFTVEHAATLEMYRADPDKVLRELRIDAPPGSPARMLFENRLRSDEPTATFALANSLAAFLVPWLLMTLACGWLMGQAEAVAKTRNRSVWAAVCVVPMALCLLLTKSRAGYLAVLVGFAALLFVAWRTRRRIWQVAVGAAVVGAVVLAIGYVSGALDVEIITESLKSLSYRWHYWQGALGMVRDHPLFGCGPGNFQDEYTRYKLPEASEVVADPHNFAFEVWATCGTPALVLLAIILLAATVESQRAGKRSAPDDSQVTGGASASRPMAPLAGGLVGLVVASAVGLFSTVELPSGVFLAGLLILPVVTVIFAPWIQHGKLPDRVPSLCVAALLVNLLAAGGIGFAGVAGSLWLLLAMSGGREDPPPVSSRAAVACAAAVLVMLAGTCYVTAYRPVLECRRWVGLAEEETARAREYLLAATQADGWSDEPWQELAAADFAHWRSEPSDELSDRWRRDQREVLRRRPHSSAAWMEAAERYFDAYRASGDAKPKQEFLAEAVRHYRRAVDLYPNYAIGHARLALALEAAGDGDAGPEAVLAIELDGQTPHADQKLRKRLFKQMQDVVARTAP
jgi:O-antigen ligase